MFRRRRHRARTLLLCLATACAIAGAAPALDDARAYPNGQAPSSALERIYHPNPSVQVYLPSNAAASWNTMRFCAVTERGRDIYPGGANSAYRRLGVPSDWPPPVYGTQWYFRGAYLAGKGNLAAVPGRSNHGGRGAVDLGNPPTMRPEIDREGNYWSWGEVPRESWHVTVAPEPFPHPNPGTSQRYPVLREGSGFSCLAKAVKEVERRLGLPQDGKLEREDVKAVRVFQDRNGLEVDSAVGPKTWVALREKTRRDGPSTNLKPPDKVLSPTAGTDVKAIQGLLNARFREAGRPTRLEEDGVLGLKTAAAVRELQQLRGLEADGIVGERTLAELRKPSAPAAASARAVDAKAVR